MIRPLLSLLLPLVFVSAAEAGSEAPDRPDWIFNSGMEQPLTLEFLGDETALFTAAEQSKDFEVRVLDADGAIIPDARTVWRAGSGTFIEVTPTGPRSARITSTGMAPTNVPFRVSVSGQNGALVGQAMFAGLRADTVQVASTNVLSSTRNGLEISAVSLARNPDTEQIQPGNIILSGDAAGIRARVEGVTILPGSVDLITRSATIPEAFSNFDYRGISEPRLITVDVPLVKSSEKGGFSCKLSGGAPAPQVQVSGPSVAVTFVEQVEIAARLPEGEEMLDFFDLRVRLLPRLTLVSGQVEFTSPLGNAEVVCAITLGPLKTKPVPLGSTGLYVAPGVTPTAGIRLNAQIDGPSLTVMGPSIADTFELEGGIVYQAGTGWQPVFDFSYLGRETALITLTARPEFTLETSIKPFVQINTLVGFSAFKGAVPIVDASFAEFEGGIKTTLTLQTPVDPDAAGYIGPTWKTDALMEGNLRGELSGGILGVILDDLGIDTAFDAGIQLFKKEVALARSPRLLLSTDCDQPCLLAPMTPVALSASADQSASGSINLKQLDSDRGVLEPFDASDYASGASFELTAPPVPRDSLTLVPQLVSDELSAILPYADVVDPARIATSETIEYRAGSLSVRATGAGQCRRASDFLLLQEFVTRQQIFIPLGLGGTLGRTAVNEQSLFDGATVQSEGIALGSFQPLAQPGSYQLHDILDIQASTLVPSTSICRPQGFDARSLGGISRNFVTLLPISYQVEVECTADSGAGGRVATVRFADIGGGGTSAEFNYTCDAANDTGGQPVLIGSGATLGVSFNTTLIEMGAGAEGTFGVPGSESHAGTLALIVTFTEMEP